MEMITLLRFAQSVVKSVDTMLNVSVAVFKEEVPITYDQYGRMNYNPTYHCNNRKPWDLEDDEYITGWYEIIGPEELSFATDRTIKSVMQRVKVLRSEGKMKKPLKKINNKRVKTL